MLPLIVHRNKARIDSILNSIDGSIHDMDIALHGVMSSHVVILCSGHIEISVCEIVKVYALQRSNPLIAKFVAETIERENSLNCKKIYKILDRFNSDWSRALENSATAAQSEAVDSLKTLRDQIAHGRSNGTGYMVVKRYYQDSCRFIECLANVVV